MTTTVLPESERQENDAASERIKRLLRRYREETPMISVQRARFYTEKWRETESSGLSRKVRVALSMKNVYEKMDIYIDPDDRIVGSWTERFLGMPIDVERGVFNEVYRFELDPVSMAKFRVSSMKDFAAWMFGEKRVGEFLRTRKSMKSGGPEALNIGIETMRRRSVNPFDVSENDRRFLAGTLLPWWRGKTAVDIVQKELYESDVLSGEVRGLLMSMPANTSRQTMMISTCATISSYQGHVIIDYEKAARLGLKAMLDEVRGAESGSEAEADYLKSVEIALEGVIVFAERLAAEARRLADNEADPTRKDELGRIAAACERAPLLPARTFREALQAAWTVKTAVELAHPVNLHSFGRMDLLLYPFYKTDIESGHMTREDARELLEELLLKIMAQNMRPESNILSNFYHRYLGSSPVTIGGLTPEGADGTNELTYLFIEAAERSKAVTNVSVRFHAGSPPELMLAVAAALGRGTSNLSLYNDDVNVEAMKRRGFSDADARDYAVMGCVEMLCPGKTGGMSANALLLCRLLDITLRGGDSRTLVGTIKNVGKKTGGPKSFKTYEEIESGFIEQARFAVEKLVVASNLRDRVYAENLPAPMISAFIDGCLEKRKDVTAGGAKYDLSGISFINSIANVVDSLHVIKKLVFDSGEITLEELLSAVDGNFAGNEKLHARIKSLDGKWGNGNPETDEIARRISTALFGETYKYKAFRGGVFVPYVISMTTHTIEGRISPATPDGRLAALPYAASCNPYNVERNGATGAMRSIASIDFKDALGAAVNMRFHPSAVGGTDEAREKWASLVRTYFKLGGAQLQPTAASAEMLEAARKNPAEWNDLVVKVGGYSAYFTELGREIQQEVISRTMHERA